MVSVKYCRVELQYTTLGYYYESWVGVCWCFPVADRLYLIATVGLLDEIVAALGCLGTSKENENKNT